MRRESTDLPADLQALIGLEVTGEPEYVERNDIRYFAEATRWPNDPKSRYVDEREARRSRFGALIAPPTYFSRLARRRGYSWSVPMPDSLRNRPGVSSDAAVELVEPVRAGDLLSTRMTVVDLYEQDHSRGKLLFLVRDFEFTNQLDQYVGKARRTTVRFLESLPYDRLPAEPHQAADESPVREIPPFSNLVTLMELNHFAGANREWGQYHMDRDFAQSLGLKDVLILESLKLAYVGNMLEDWVGDEGWVQRIDLSYYALDFVGDTLTCRGRVTSTSNRDGQTVAECQVWIENRDGRQGTTGSATVLLSAESAAAISQE